MRLGDQVTLVVGGGQGLGRVIALTFAEEGADVVVVGRTKAKVDAVSQEIRAKGRRSIGIPADATNEKQVEAVVEQTIRELGRINVLVNAAGFSGPSVPVVDIGMEDWQAVMAVNLTAPFICCKAVLRRMIEQRSGSIVNISGTVGKEGWNLRGALSAAKFGVLGLTQTMAMEAGPYNVRVNAICPGGIYGERMKHVLEERAKTLGITVEEVERQILDQTPLRRHVMPEDVARAAVFLASAESSGTTGEALNVSSGYIMH